MKVKHLFLSLGTVIILFVGAFAPNIIFVLQDKNVMKQVNQYTMNTVQINIGSPSGISDILRIIDGETKMTYLESSKKHNHNAEEAYLSALETIAFFTESDIEKVKEAYIRHKESPAFITDKDWTDVVFVWQCQLSNKSEDIKITILLDDESGKMIAFQYSGLYEKEKDGGAYTRDRGDWSDTYARDWSDRCARYYEFKSASTKARDGMEGNFSHLFVDLKNESLELYSTIKVIIDSDNNGSMIYFNFNYNQSSVKEFIREEP